MSKKGQITIFVILGLIIIVALLIIFLFFQTPEVVVVDHSNPQAFIESCVRGATEESISLLSPRGGDISPVGYIFFENEEIKYLCYTGEFYQPCVNQRPLLIEHIENEITEYITPIVQECFLELKESLETRYDIEDSNMEIETRLQSGNVEVRINRDFKLIRKGDVRDFTNFRMIMVHPIYDFAKISMEIVNQEITYCNFDELGFNILYPRFDVTKFITGESNIIYRIKEVNTGEMFSFAVKSCTLPAGY